MLPANSGPTICPIKIAIGKFQGLIVKYTPLPSYCSSFISPVGPFNFIDVTDFVLNR